MDATAIAAEAGSLRNLQFDRHWTGSPPTKRERPGPSLQPRPQLESRKRSLQADTARDLAVQRVQRAAARCEASP
jgi:hypothetical protein